MKKHTRMLALILCCTLLFTQAPAYAYGTQLHASQLTLANGAVLRSVVSKLPNGERQSSNFIEYTPNTDVTPIVAYGSKIYGRSDINTVASYVESQGMSVVGGVNGDYYVLDTGVPIGLVVNDGRLVSSDAWQPAVGFRADGTAIIGKPEIYLRATNSAGVVSNINYLNKTRTKAGSYLYSTDFSAQTHISSSGTNVTLRILDDDVLRVGGTLRAQVERIDKTSSSTPIAEGTLVYSVADDAPEAARASLANFTVGDVITITAAASDERFSEAVYACGGKELLVTSGNISPNLSASVNPRTAVGVKADGTVLFYTADGRQTDISRGLSLQELAAEFKALGCVSALNLDGGGSTSLAVKNPGDAAVTVQNIPSEGSLRKNANFIFLVNNAPKTGDAARAFVYPYDFAMLKGALAPLTVKFTDENYHAAGTGEIDRISQSREVGELVGDSFYATSADTAVLSVYSDGLKGEAHVTVTEEIDRLVIRRGTSANAITSLTLSPGDQTDLNLEAWYGGRKLLCSDDLFTYSLPESLGTVTKDGVLTASSILGATGTLTIRYLGKTVAELPVTVGKLPQLVDGFETLNWQLYGTFEEGAVRPASAAIASQPADVRYGAGALGISYDFSAQESKVMQFVPISKVTLSNTPDYLNLWVCGDGSNNTLGLHFFNTSGNTAGVSVPIDFTGWKAVSLPLPKNAASLYAITLTTAEGYAAKGRVLLDQMIVSFNAPVDATQYPAITVKDLSDGAVLEMLPKTLLAKVVDQAGSPITAANISVVLDQNALEATYNALTGDLSIHLPEELWPGIHRLTITAKSAIGNIERFSLSFTMSGASPAVFADMDHWARAQVEALYRRGIVTGESKADGIYYYPQKNASRMEAAALICRANGIDTDAYTDVALPYADAAKIPAWALPYVRALYATGLMSGRNNGGVLYFDPTANLTRAEAFTIIGRSLEQGYRQDALTFSDASSVPSWALAHFEKLVSSGIVSGYSDNTIRPTNNITKAEFASLLFNTNAK